MAGRLHSSMMCRGVEGETAKEQYNAQVKVAVDRIWEKVVPATDEGRIGLQDLYCAI